MPKPTLFPADELLEREIIATLLAGLKEWRPDLHYPESHSDMQGCVRALMVMFEVKRRPLPVKLVYPCWYCNGTGYLNSIVDGILNKNYCPKCKHGKITDE